MPFYGGLPEAGGFRPVSEYLIGAQSAAEATHCLLGSIERSPRKTIYVEHDHITEEMGLIEKALREYSKDLYVRQLERDPDKARRTFANIDKVAPKLAAKARRFLGQHSSWFPEDREVTAAVGAAYRFIIEMCVALQKSAVVWGGDLDAGRRMLTNNNAYGVQAVTKAAKELRQRVDPLIARGKRKRAEKADRLRSVRSELAREAARERWREANPPPDIEMTGDPVRDISRILGWESVCRRGTLQEAKQSKAAKIKIINSVIKRIYGTVFAELRDEYDNDYRLHQAPIRMWPKDGKLDVIIMRRGRPQEGPERVSEVWAVFQDGRLVAMQNGLGKTLWSEVGESRIAMGKADYESGKPPPQSMPRGVVLDEGKAQNLLYVQQRVYGWATLAPNTTTEGTPSTSSYAIRVKGKYSQRAVDMNLRASPPQLSTNSDGTIRGWDKIFAHLETVKATLEHYYGNLAEGSPATDTDDLLDAALVEIARVFKTDVEQYHHGEAGTVFPHSHIAVHGDYGDGRPGVRKPKITIEVEMLGVRKRTFPLGKQGFAIKRIIAEVQRNLKLFESYPDEAENIAEAQDWIKGRLMEQGFTSYGESWIPTTPESFMLDDVERWARFRSYQRSGPQGVVAILKHAHMKPGTYRVALTQAAVKTLPVGTRAIISKIPQPKHPAGGAQGWAYQENRSAGA